MAIQGSMRDVTERVLAQEARNRLAEERRNFYRATIDAFTGGRLEIIDPDEAEEMTRDPEVTVDIITPEDAEKARNVVREICKRHDLNGDDIERFLLAVGEAVTNAIKHGQGGKVRVGFNGEDVWVAVTDRGPGIETLAIPRVTLQRGYSSKTSLGMGYSMMLETADRVWLSTGPDGTTVIMTCCAQPAPASKLLESLTDTW
jgi:anti-sigma regulatory factor (Ser/Thr protein kinase)